MVSVASRIGGIVSPLILLLVSLHFSNGAIHVHSSQCVGMHTFNPLCVFPILQCAILTFSVSVV